MVRIVGMFSEWALIYVVAEVLDLFGTEHRETLPRIAATGINKFQSAASSL
jgi:hypothetical protein